MITSKEMRDIRAHYSVSPGECRALCDALEAAWAERDALLEEVKDYEDSGLTEGRARHWRERAERAEALCDAVVQTYETRLARVRELVDEADGEPKRLFWPSEILAAIEGDNR